MAVRYYMNLVFNMEDSMHKGKIIFLNGVSSSGKSTLSKELVRKLPDYFHFSVDDFDCIIEKMEDREREHLIPVPTEYFYHRTITMFSDKGVNLILDHILHDEFTTKDCLEVLRDYPVLFVGVHCPLEEIERREEARGDRHLGQARSQLKFVHQQKECYDIEVDTFNESLEVCSERIIELVGNSIELTGWKKTTQSTL
jgi:chloramphenicol 3-O phosphotransferase